MSSTLSPVQRDKHRRLQEDYPYFSRHALKIKDKDGQIVPFIFNTAQQYLHAKLEKQYRELGRIRAYILKGRQQGCSTYVGGRFYHKATRNSGKSVFILSHQAQTTDKLFNIVDRFHKYTPSQLRPETDIANRRQLSFSNLNSDYTIGTAGSGDVGRGGTIQFFHGSEVAFWENTDSIVTGVLQSVPDLPGTEIILESTANGEGNLFHTGCIQAVKRKSEYILVFIPWFWQLEYRKNLPDQFELTQEEEELKLLYQLDDNQIYWRRIKIIELGSLLKFKQEYPMTVDEAFQASGERLISSEAITQARKSNIKDPFAPKILGVDPGRNKDRSVLVDRQGRHMRFFKVYRKEVTEGKDSQWEMRLAGIIARRIDEEQYDKVFIDCTKGWGTVDRLHEMGYHKEVVGVNFGEKAIEDETYLNMRAEMWCNLRDWFHNGNVNCPDDDEFHLDLRCMPDEKQTSNGLIKLESKDKIIKEFKQSPDIGDAAALTFAYPVKREQRRRYHKNIRKQETTSHLRTLRRVRRQATPRNNVATSLNYFGQ